MKNSRSLFINFSNARESRKYAFYSYTLLEKNWYIDKINKSRMHCVIMFHLNLNVTSTFWIFGDKSHCLQIFETTLTKINNCQFRHVGKMYLLYTLMGGRILRLLC